MARLGSVTMQLIYPSGVSLSALLDLRGYGMHGCSSSSGTAERDGICRWHEAEAGSAELRYIFDSSHMKNGKLHLNKLRIKNAPEAVHGREQLVCVLLSCLLLYQDSKASHNGPCKLILELRNRCICTSQYIGSKPRLHILTVRPIIRQFVFLCGPLALLSFVPCACMELAGVDFAGEACCSTHKVLLAGLRKCV